ncbi:MAG TPA: DUF2341 domain-containing protein, partial [Methanomicrobiales archaeon]|nr:DUF2341 domain-containing protein [Methanomicrobiales archaeon]
MSRHGVTGEGARAVSEAIGTIVLVGMVMVGVVLVGMLLLSGPTATKVPVFDAIISNQSKTVYIYHKGGDALYAGTYKVFVNGNDSTAYFSIMSPYGDPFSVGKTLVGTLPYIPVHVAIVYNQTGGGATVLAGQDLYGTATLTQNPNSWYFNPTANNCSWRYRKKITIAHGQVTADQSSFPVLVTLTSDPDLTAHARTDGNDIVFTGSDGVTKLNHEIENYTAGSLVAWVNVPALSSSTDTVLYLYYGNTTSPPQQNRNAVWDANFKAVWHLGEVGTTGANAYNDSTSTANNGQGGGGTAGAVPAQVAGKIGYAQSFDGANDYIATSTNFATKPDVFTLSVWFKTSMATSGKLIGFEDQRTGTASASFDRHLYVGTNNRLVSGVWNLTPGAAYFVKSPAAVNDGAWHYAVMTMATDTQSLYLDGSLVGQNVSLGENPMSAY